MSLKSLEECSVEIEWFDVGDNSVLISSGVYLVGYLGGVLVGFNEIILGDLVTLFDPDRVLEKKYQKLRLRRLANEHDPSDRYVGLNTPPWPFKGLWRVVSVNPDGSFGVSLRLNQNIPDLFVQPEQIEPLKNSKELSV